MPPSGRPVADLLGLARQARGLYHRHPGRLEVPATGDVRPTRSRSSSMSWLRWPGPAERPARLETVGLFAGGRLFAQTEIAEQRDGQDMTQWQGSLAGYLVQIAAR